MRNQRDSRPRGFLVALAALCLVPLAIAPASQPAASNADLEQVIEEIRAAHAEAREKLTQLPRERLDRMWVVEQADQKADRLAGWVRDHTRWVPYRGVLRGADGVLLDRQGNSLDRSLLLHALLEDAGHEARLVRGQLSAEAVAQVLQQADTGRYEPLSVDSHATPEARAAVGRAAEQAAELAKMVELSDSAWMAGVEQAVADHWWVEVKAGSAWQALDPLLAGPLEHLRPEAAARFGTGKLPDELFHTVTMRVVVEQWNAGAVTEGIPLQHSVRAADARYFDLELQFVPFGFEVAPDNASARTEAIAIAETTQEWLPVIRSGTRVDRQQGFDATGRLQRRPTDLAAPRKLTQATKALGGLGRSAPVREAVLSACWIEYEVAVPGGDTQIVRREIFDLVGPARRQSRNLADVPLDRQAVRERGLALAGVTRILVTNNLLPPVALEKASLEFWALQGPQIAAFARLLADPSAEEPLQRFYREPLVALDLLGFGVVRGEVSRHRTALYQGSPNIFTTHYVPAAGEDLVVARSVDLVANQVGVIGTGSRPAAHVRLEQGVLDTVLEAALSEAKGTRNNTAELFAERGRATGPWSAARNWSDSSRLPASARARMAGSVAAGRTVVAPEWVGSGHEPAWWEIDAATGTTLGIGSKGWGQHTPSDVTLRTVGTGGTSKGAQKVGHKVSCAVVIAYLRTAGMTIQMQGNAVVMTPHLLKWLRSYGCSL